MTNKISNWCDSGAVLAAAPARTRRRHEALSPAVFPHLVSVNCARFWVSRDNFGFQRAYAMVTQKAAAQC